MKSLYCNERANTAAPFSANAIKDAIADIEAATDMPITLTPQIEPEFLSAEEWQRRQTANTGGLSPEAMGLPSDKGKKRYHPDGIYKGNFADDDSEFWEVCTCKASCNSSCKGECGCRACNMAYHDFLSAD